MSVRMSKQAISDFLDRVTDQAELREEIHQVFAKTEDSDRPDTVVKLAKTHGFEFSAEEFLAALEQRYANPTAELSEAELESVAGGMFPASSNDGGMCIGFPDVCKTPVLGVPVPVPMPSIGTLSGAKSTTTKVTFGTKGDNTKG